jgi:crotonobetainyl-CoA:carnitine CoA-transferase CaiB-like acyl-CoA transferase
VPAASASALPLLNCTVVDFSWLLPGQFATRILRDLGARVIKIELPGGDYIRDLRPRGYASVNRGKQSVTLDLKQDASREVLYRLVSKADVFVEGFRPGVAARLGGGYEQLSSVRPELIYCSISGFGQQGTRKDRAGHGLNYSSLAGMQSLAGRSTALTPSIADVASSLYAAIAILSAMVAVPRIGQYIDLSITDSVFGLMTEMLAGDHGAIVEDGNAVGAFGVFEAADGALLSVGAVEDHFWTALCDAIGRPEWRSRPGWDSFEGRCENGTEIQAGLQSLFALRSRDELLQLLDRAGVPAEPVNGLAEAVVDPAATERLVISWIDEPELGMVPQVGFPAHFATWGEAEAAPAPRIGEHTESILRELEFSQEEIQLLQSNGAV